MGKIRVATLGDEAQEKKHKESSKARREAKKLEKEKTHVKGLGLKGGQQIKVIEGVELKPEIEAALHHEEVSQEKPVKKPNIMVNGIKGRIKIFAGRAIKERLPIL